MLYDPIVHNNGFTTTLEEKQSIAFCVPLFQNRSALYHTALEPWAAGYSFVHRLDFVSIFVIDTLPITNQPWEAGVAGA